jgi:hypothetical protein
VLLHFYSKQNQHQQQHRLQQQYPKPNSSSNSNNQLKDLLVYLNLKELQELHYVDLVLVQNHTTTASKRNNNHQVLRVLLPLLPAPDKV